MDLYAIYTSSIWAEKTEFDQKKSGLVVKQRVYNKSPLGFQGFAFNLRREKFQDPRVREALCHLLNRDLMNEKLMYNAYFMLNSYYPDLYKNNVNPDIPVRKFDMEKARGLLKEAGWEPGEDGILQKDGKPFEITFMTASKDPRHINVYVEDLKKVGIVPKIEQLSYATIWKRIDEEQDFDMYWVAWSASRLRDPESIWHSKTANEQATSNLPGVADKQVDEVIEALKTERDLDKRNALLKKLDKRLTEIIPYALLWQSGYSRILYWNKFGVPDSVLGKFGDEDNAVVYWWIDPDKEKALEDAKANGKTLDADHGDKYYED